jgi:hypothetical protein
LTLVPGPFLASDSPTYPRPGSPVFFCRSIVLCAFKTRDLPAYPLTRLFFGARRRFHRGPRVGVSIPRWGWGVVLSAWPVSTIYCTLYMSTCLGPEPLCPGPPWHRPLHVQRMSSTCGAPRPCSLPRSVDCQVLRRVLRLPLLPLAVTPLYHPTLRGLTQVC